jgi:DNA-binding transcriptional LysR family regulator
MDRLEALRALVATVDLGSLSAAARASRRSPASVTRAIASLEERLGTELLRRTTRSLRLTEAGARYLEVARRVLAELDEAESSASAATSAPRGLLTVTAPIAFGSMHVRPIIERYLQGHEHVRVRLLLLDRIVNVVDEGVDVAVRIGDLPDSALLASAVGHVRRVVVASPDYLARHGTPEVPAELARHRCISLASLTAGDVWSFAGGKHVTVKPVLQVNLADAAIASARAGLGVVSVLSYQVASLVRGGELVRVLAPHEPPPVPVQLVHPGASVRTAKVRAFVDLAAPSLRAALARAASELDARRSRPKARS